MHGINGDHRAGQYKRAEQSLDGRDFIGFFVTVEMRQHQSRVGGKGAEYVRGAAVEKVVKASPQCLAIDRHMTLTFAVRRVVQHGGMAAERRFDRGWIKLSQDATNRRVSRGLSPLHAERIAQPSEVNIDEAVDSPIRVGTSDNCPDRKQHDVWQAIQLPSRPPRVLNFSQQIDKWTEWHPCAAVKVASKAVTWNRVAGTPYAAIRRRFASACGISDSPGPLSHH